MKQVKTEFFFKVGAILQTNFKCEYLGPSKYSLRGRPAESQLWRQHPNLFIWANQDDFTPKVWRSCFTRYCLTLVFHTLVSTLTLCFHLICILIFLTLSHISQVKRPIPKTWNTCLGFLNCIAHFKAALCQALISITFCYCDPWFCIIK